MLIPNKIREVINIKNGIQEALGGHDAYHCIAKLKRSPPGCRPETQWQLKRTMWISPGLSSSCSSPKAIKLFLKLPPMSTNILNKEILLNL
jgi:hypothetical protein